MSAAVGEFSEAVGAAAVLGVNVARMVVGAVANLTIERTIPISPGNSAPR